MDLEKNNRINLLLDFYGKLLTGKQATYAEEYYADDYSLAEIAENFDVSRQAVYDNIKRTVAILEDYENKLHLYRDFAARNQLTDQLRDYIKANYPSDENLNHLVERLENSEED